MDKVIYFNNSENVSSMVYYDFIDYAFSKTDYFMLVYINYYGKGYTSKQKFFRMSLEKFKVKSRSNPSWPGTLHCIAPNTTYKVVFYKTDQEAKKFLKMVDRISEWSGGMPEDLAFFKRNQCWFYSVGHEKIAAIIHATVEDIAFVDSLKIASKNEALDHKDNYFDAYDEQLTER